MRSALASTLVALSFLGANGSAVAEETAVPPGRDAPRPWLVPAGVLSATAGSDAIQFRPAGYVRFGLGDIADFSLGARADLVSCVDAECDDDEAPAAAVASFRLGHQWNIGVPVAGLVGFERTIASSSGPSNDDTDRSLGYARLRTSAGVVLGPARLSAGVDVAQGRIGDREAGDLRVRPFGAVELHLSKGSRTVVLAESAFEPIAIGDQMDLRWVATAGVRYVARDWISSELLVRGSASDRSFIMISSRFHIHSKLFGN